MDDQSTLTIRGFRFSRWRRGAGRKRPRLHRRDYLSVLLALAVGAVLLVALEYASKSDSRKMERACATTVIVGTMAWVVWLTARVEGGRGTWRIREAEKLPKPAVPDGLPEDAVPCIALVSSGRGGRHSEPGWSWLENGILRYRDEYMEFALRPQDVGDLEDLLVFECATLNLPEGFPRLTMGLTPAIEVAGYVVHWWPGEGPLCELAERWKASTSDGDPLYPPIERVQKRC